MLSTSRHRGRRARTAAPAGHASALAGFAVRHRFAVSGLVVLLVLTIGGLVALPVIDTAARVRVAAVIAEQVQAELGLDQAPDVSVAGDDFLWQAARGEYDGATISAPTVAYEGVTLGTTRVRLRQMKVPRRVLLGGDGIVTIGSGDASAVLPWAELDARASDAVGTDVALSRDGGALVADAEVGSIPLALTGEPRVEDGAIVLSPTSVEVAGRELSLSAARTVADALGLGRASEALLDGITFGLDEVPEQLTVERAAVARDGLRISGSLSPVEVPVTG